MMKITENKISLRGKALHCIIKGFMDLPFNKKTGFLENGARISKMPRLWIKPKGYILNKYNIDGVPCEELVYEDKTNNNLILHFHGGAYVMRFFDQYRMVAHKYSKISNRVSIFQ